MKTTAKMSDDDDRQQDNSKKLQNLLLGLINEPTGDCMWIPRDWGEGVGTKEEGEGTWS